ncbi:unnamed protein product, partial [Meganyctiphanes norvegica]
MTESCPTNYANLGEECFWFSEGMADWDNAQTDCNLRGDILAVPSDILSFIDEINRLSPRNVPYFIGGKMDSAGQWKWQDENGSLISNRYWATGQHSELPNSKCTTVTLGYYGLQKRDCSHLLKYICTRNVNQEPPHYNNCYTIPILTTLTILLLFLIVGLSVYAYVERKRLQETVKTSVKCLVKHDSENSLYGKMK